DGSFKGTFQIGANEGQSLDLSVGAMGAAALGLTASATVETGVTATGLQDGTYTVDGTDLKDASGNIVGKVNGQDIELADTAGTAITFSETPANKSLIIVKDGKAELRTQLTNDATKLAAGNYEID